MDGSLRVLFMPRTVPCRASIDIDKDYPLLNCTLEHSAPVGSQPLLTDALDSVFAIRPSSRTVTFNGLEILCSQRWHLSEITLSISPQRWTRIALHPVDVSGDVFVDFDAVFDLDGRFSSPLDVDVQYDERTLTLAVQPHGPVQAATWHRAADRVLVSVSSNGELAGFRLLGVAGV